MKAKRLWRMIGILLASVSSMLGAGCAEKAHAEAVPAERLSAETVPAAGSARVYYTGDISPAEPTMADIGILASLDPVALDKACLDLVFAAHDGHDLVERINSRNGTLAVSHAETIGLGSRQYELIRLNG
jgi:hypothetical protein